ncbi:unnamed protein product [Prorocentrum cordatum]|uniref:WW domain-containing protein n=1 Tax=Prorocentrum cordatum TaxID=2364126 RepID=A0ABN9PS86_9DINO|nr:unnamed protein product [Polarella glacialis]|mmetsp:Transcript_37889/g.100320  ORF Transcript_37889/g.100320 Transcript_37889/m.100320 type:complete len:216 (-) Transcript_37889:380-1027(-)
MGARASATIPVAPASDWAPYVAASGIVDCIDDEAAIHFVADALQSTPLPSPWVIGTGGHGKRQFINAVTGEATWKHPLDATLRSLADLYHRCAPLCQESRDAMLSRIHQKWDTEAKDEYSRWRTVKLDEGDEYYFNTATQEAIWEHPAEVFLPGHYMRVRAIERLRSQRYLSGLRSRACIACSNCSLEREADDESEPSEWRLNLDPPEASWVSCA